MIISKIHTAFSNLPLTTATPLRVLGWNRQRIGLRFKNFGIGIVTLATVEKTVGVSTWEIAATEEVNFDNEKACPVNPFFAFASVAGAKLGIIETMHDYTGFWRRKD